MCAVTVGASFYLVAVPAVILLGFSKGGFAGLGLMSTPLLALVMSPIQAAGIILPILIVQDVFTVFAYRRSWDLRNLIVLVPGALAGVVTGYILAAKVSDAAIMLIVGSIALVFASRRLALIRRGAVSGGARPAVWIGVICGVASGFTSMIANAGTPPFQMYVLPQRLRPDVLVGTSAIFFAATNWIKVLPFFMLGQFSRDNLLVSASLLPIAIASTWIGVLLVRRLDAARFYPLIYGLLFCVGAKLLWDGTRLLV
jgi:uncharacterized membrane protein YfcA